jgi:hypothetical protein
VCYFLYLASPLTLSEVRSMLPAGITADLLPPAEQRLLTRDFPDARSAVRLLRGSCSCDLVRGRGPDLRRDEAHLRRRYFRLALPRDRIIACLERHRRAETLPAPPAGRLSDALAAFVAEHARNAGPSLYLLQFAAAGLADQPADAAPPAGVSSIAVRETPDGWLTEGRRTIVA